jgi:hypothetical protein
VTQVQRPGHVEGWQKDPYGRHELRFFDGQRWTPYVRDGETSGVDEPGGPVAETAATATRSPLLDEDLLVVERFTDLGRRWSDRALTRPDGTQAGTLRRAAPSVEAGMRGVLQRDVTKNDVVELVDGLGKVALTLIRPLVAPRTAVEVRDAEDRVAGRIVQQTLRRDDTTYAFLGPSGRFLGDLQAENWVGWDLRIVDSHGRQVATITRDFTGLDLARFTRPDDYVVRIADGVHGPLRTLVVACALSLEVAVRPDARGL